jgi:uncharacterized protein (TIGR02594 family)
MTTATKPAWYVWATRELGQKEVPGRGSNPRILEYRKIGKTPLAGDDSDVPWCAIFINAALEGVGVKGTRSGMARSYERSTDFVRLAGPAEGAIVTKWRGSPKSGLGHVGFYVGHDANGRVVFLGGIQGDAVSRASFKPGEITGYWWPKGVALPKVGVIKLGAAVNTATEV